MKRKHDPTEAKNIKSSPQHAAVSYEFTELFSSLLHKDIISVSRRWNRILFVSYNKLADSEANAAIHNLALFLATFMSLKYTKCKNYVGNIFLNS